MGADRRRMDASVQAARRAERTGHGEPMSAYTRLCAELLFPLHERLKAHDTVRIRRSLEESQWWAPERLRALQTERLRNFLAEIGARVPYFRDLFKSSGFDPSKVSRVADLERLPRQGKT